MAATTAANKGGLNDGWAEYRRLVLAELERLSTVVATTQAQNVNLQMSMAQALNDAKHHILDKLHETVKALDDDYERKVKSVENDAEKRLLDLEKRHAARIDEVKKDLDKQQSDLEKTDREVVRISTKAGFIGAVAGFVVAVGGVIATLWAGK